MSHYEYSALSPSSSETEREQDYMNEIRHQQVTDKLTEVEADSLYIRNLLDHMNDKLFQPVKNSMMRSYNTGF